MYRCLTAFAVPFIVAATFAAPAAAQVQRAFPQNALRGTIAFGQPPEILLNGDTSRLSPGSRIRGPNNLLVVSGQLIGKKAIVNYTIDAAGLVHDVWILREEEAQVRPWPTSIGQTQTWSFDPAAQKWTRP